MSPWEIFVNLATWVGLMILLFLLLFILWIALDAMWREFVKTITRGRRELNRYIQEARAISERYRDDTTPEFREGFLAGARWGWGFFSRIKTPSKVKR